MLEVRYNKTTKEVTGWWATRHGNHDVKLKDRPDEVIVLLDIPIPEKGCDAYLYDEATQSLIPNPDYVEPEPLVFTASPPGTAIGKRLNNIEDFLERLYPG